MIDCGLQSVPGHVISRLRKLRTLNVAKNKLATFPPVGQWTQLRELRFSKNFLTALPDGIADLPHLERASINGNCITTLSWEVLRKLPLLGAQKMPEVYDAGRLKGALFMRDRLVPTVG